MTGHKLNQEGRWENGANCICQSLGVYFSWPFLFLFILSKGVLLILSLYIF